MPDFPSRADGTVPQAGDGALDELLAASQPAQDVAEELAPVTAVLTALRAAPTGSKLAVITAAAAVAVCGTMIAAYVGALSGPLQQAVHDVLAVPGYGAAHGR